MVGHVPFSPVSVEAEPPDEVLAVVLAMLAVLPARQRRGADADLMESGDEPRRLCGYDAILVLGALNGYAVWRGTVRSSMRSSPSGCSRGA